MRNQRVILAFGDLIIPVLGYYWWNWDLHFIFLFYYLDVLSSVVSNGLKLNKISLFRTGKSQAAVHIRQLVSWYIFVLIGLAAFEVGMLFLYPDLNLMGSLIYFLKYEEMGIPQGAILLPLIFLMNYQQYQLTFIRNGAFRVLPTHFVANLAKTSFLLFAAAGILFLVLNIVFPPLPDYVWLWTVIAAKLFFDLIIYPKLEHYFANRS